MLNILKKMGLAPQEEVEIVPEVIPEFESKLVISGLSGAGMVEALYSLAAHAYKTSSSNVLWIDTHDNMMSVAKNYYLSLENNKDFYLNNISSAGRVGTVVAKNTTNYIMYGKSFSRDVLSSFIPDLIEQSLVPNRFVLWDNNILSMLTQDEKSRVLSSSNKMVFIENEPVVYEGVDNLLFRSGKQDDQTSDFDIGEALFNEQKIKLPYTKVECKAGCFPKLI